MKALEGKIALITGASKGIGRAIAHTFAAQGAHVAFTYLSSVVQGESLVAELKAKGVDAKGYRSDASNYEAAQELITDVVRDFGKLDILINNAGITRDNLLMRMSESQWDEIMEINLKSCFNTPYLAGAAAAAVVGLLAIYLVMGAVKRGKLEYFAYYCFTAGIAGMIYFSQS